MRVYCAAKAVNPIISTKRFEVTHHDLPDRRHAHPHRHRQAQQQIFSRAEAADAR